MDIPLDRQQHIYHPVQGMVRAVSHVNLVKTHIIGPRYDSHAVWVCEIVVPVSHKLFQHEADSYKQN